jgi:hypothetical protein
LKKSKPGVSPFVQEDPTPTSREQEIRDILGVAPSESFIGTDSNGRRGIFIKGDKR